MLCETAAGCTIILQSLTHRLIHPVQLLYLSYHFMSLESSIPRCTRPINQAAIAPRNIGAVTLQFGFMFMEDRWAGKNG